MIDASAKQNWAIEQVNNNGAIIPSNAKLVNDTTNDLTDLV